MKKIILLVVLFGTILFAQGHDQGVFGTDLQPVTIATLGAADDSLVSRQVAWRDWGKMSGTLTVHGYLKMTSGTSKVVTIKLAHLLDSPGEQHILGTKTVPVSPGIVNFEYNVAAQDWWEGCRGFVLYFVPSAVGSVIEVKAKELSK